MKVLYGNKCDKCGEWFESETPDLDTCPKCESKPDIEKLKKSKWGKDE